MLPRAVNFYYVRQLCPHIKFYQGWFGMQALMDCCCGLDVHKEKVFACILRGPAEEEPECIEAEFETHYDALVEMCRWIASYGCSYVAMESTGVYWRPIYQTCEEYWGENCLLVVVNAYHMHNLPGRKSDVKDAQWIATLFRHGLLEPSFVPEHTIRTLREFSRLYRLFVEERACYANRLEKFLQTSGLKLSSVLSSILGQSGRNILARLAETGRLSASDICEALNRHVRKSPAEVAAAMKGQLGYAQRLYLRTLLDKIEDCDARIDALHEQMLVIAAPYQLQLDQLDSIPGIDSVAALSIMAEISATPQKNFANAKRLTSWAGLVPRNDESAGRAKSRKVTKGNPYIKSILCQVAWSAVRVRSSPFHEWFWSHQGKLGKKKAIIAVSRRILALCYKLLESDGFYDPILAGKPIQSHG